MIFFLGVIRQFKVTVYLDSVNCVSTAAEIQDVVDSVHSIAKHLADNLPEHQRWLDNYAILVCQFLKANADKIGRLALKNLTFVQKRTYDIETKF